MSIESCIVRLPGTSKSYPFDEHRRDERGDLRYMIAHGTARRVGEAHRPVGRERAERERVRQRDWRQGRHASSLEVVVVGHYWMACLRSSTGLGVAPRAR